MKAEDKAQAKHVPERTCIACRSVKPKRDLVRLVRLDDKRVAPDPGGRMPGRGLYLCRQPECWQKALKEKQIERSLRSGISPENRTELQEYARTMLSLQD